MPLKDIRCKFSDNNPSCFILEKNENMVELSPDEAVIYNGFLEEDINNLLERRAIYLPNSKSKKPPIEQHFQEMRAELPKNSQLVLLDTQTIFNAQDCLNGHVSPLNLLDLATFTTAAIYFDNIVLQPHFYLNENFKKHTDFLSVIQWPKQYPKQYQDTLWTMLDRSFLDEKRLAESWEKFFNLPSDSITINLYSFDKYQDSPYQWNGIVASYYIDGSYESELCGDGIKSGRDEFLSIQTMRVIFNDRLASFLNIPYYSSSLKSCIHSEIIRKKTEMQFILDELLNFGEDKCQFSKENSPYMRHYSAPFLLGLILEQMKTPDDYWEILLSYRNQFAPFRKKISKDKAEWEKGGKRRSQYLNNYLKHLTKFNDSITSKTMDATAAVGSTLSTINNVEFAIIGLGIKLLKLMNVPEKLHNLYLEYFKPEIYLMISLANETKQLSIVEERILDIWGVEWTRNEHDLLKLYSDSTPYSFSKLKKV